MKEQINILIELQRILTESAALSEALAAVPGQLELLDSRLKRSEEEINDKESFYQEQKKNYRRQELEVQAVLSRIQASQSKLSAVKTNKEYQALLKEIDEQKAKNSELEDDMLDFLEHMDQSEADIAELKSFCRVLAADISAEKADIRQTAEQKNRLLQKLKAEREQTMARLDPALLKRFWSVKAAHPDGLAVASVTHAVCSGCNLNIPPQMFNELQKAETIRLCPTCERIIYWLEA